MKAQIYSLVEAGASACIAYLTAQIDGLDIFLPRRGASFKSGAFF